MNNAERQRAVSPQPVAWMYQVRFTGEDGRQETAWRNYGVYLSKAAAECGMRHAGDGLGCRVVPLYAMEEQYEEESMAAPRRMRRAIAG